MNLKAIAVLFVLTLPLTGCGNKGPLLLPTPVAPAAEATPVEPAPDATAPADETVPVDTTTTPAEPDPATDDQNG